MSSERSPLLPSFITPTNAQVDAVKATAFSLSEALAALKAGKMPTHEQFDRLLQKALDSDVLSLGVGKTGRTGRLSEEGARVVKAFREVLQAVRNVGEQKNGDNKIQEMIFSLSHIEPPTPTKGHTFEVSSSSTLPSRREMDKDSTALLSSLQKILTLLVTSSEFRLVINQVLSLSTGLLADAAGKVAETAKEVEEKARETGDDNKPIDYDEAAQKGKKVAKGLVSGRIQGQARESALNTFEGLSNYFEDKLGDDEEAKDALFEKLKKVIVDVQANPDYTKSIDTILTLIKKYGKKADALADEATEKVKEDADQTPIQEALAQSKALIEVFASNEPLDPVLNSAKQIKEDVQRDNRVGDYFSDVGKFLEACLKVEGYVVSQRAYRRSSDLWERGQSLLAEDEVYKKDINQLVASLESYGHALADDEATQDLAFKVERLSDELTIAGKHGINALKASSSGLYRDFVDVILPRAVDLVKEIPCPRVEFKSEAVDFVIDDISFESASFVPSNIRIINHNDFLATQGFAAYAVDYDSSLKLHVDGLKFHATDISYWLHKKSGFITFEDQGLLDIAFDNEGISFDVTLENAGVDDRETFFVVKKVDVDISDLEYHISRNSSWMLYFSKPFVSGLLKKNLQHSLEAQISKYLRDADLQLYGLQNRAIAATNAKPSPMNYLKAIFSPSVFSSASRTSLTQSGVITTGKRGEYILAVGVDEEMFPGKAGPAASWSKRFIEKAKDVTGLGADVAHDAKYQAKAAQIDAQREADKLGLHVKEYQRKLERQDGWKSSAFDVSV